MKILKETETEETILFFVTFLSLAEIQLGVGRAPAPPECAYGCAESERIFSLWL